MFFVCTCIVSIIIKTNAPVFYLMFFAIGLFIVSVVVVLFVDLPLDVMELVALELGHEVELPQFTDVEKQ